jgi:ferric-dicitrate binding protein FerR (iron transport regulator)
VQVHGFTAEEGSDFLQTYERGLEHARAAIEEGLAAEAEIQSRRRWLAISLIAIVAVLIGLGLKIRELSAGEQRIAST